MGNEKSKTVLWLLLLTGAFGGAWAEDEQMPQDPMWKNAVCTNPRLPHSIIRSRESGTVSVLFDINTDGKVENIRITESRPSDRMDYGVTRALGRWEYFLYFENGEAAERKDIPLTFTYGPENTESCTHSSLPELPSTAGRADDPFNQLSICSELMMPKREARKKISGQVSLRYDIDKKGKVHNVAVTSQQPDDRFSEIATSALSRWKYHEFLQTGVPVPRPGMSLTMYFGDLPETANKNTCGYAAWDSRGNVIEVEHYINK